MPPVKRLISTPSTVKGFFLPLDFESTKAGRPAPAAHRMPIAEAQTAAGVKLPAADHRAAERRETSSSGFCVDANKYIYINLQYNAFII